MIALHEMKQGVQRSMFGIPGLDQLPAELILNEIASINGCSENLAEMEDGGFIDTRRTLEGMKLSAETIWQACARKGRILFGTGHPGAMLGF
jgi:hypothetical protein